MPSLSLSQRGSHNTAQRKRYNTMTTRQRFGLNLRIRARVRNAWAIVASMPDPSSSPPAVKQVRDHLKRDGKLRREASRQSEAAKPHGVINPEN